jgi:N utilization substance protein B
MQSAYSLLIAASDNLPAQEAYLEQSIWRLHELYTLQSQLFTLLLAKATKQRKANLNSFTGNKTRLETSLNFVQNKVLNQYKDSPTLANYPLEDNAVKWDDFEEIVDLVWQKVHKSNTYATFMELEKPNYNTDKEFVITMFKKHIAPNEDLADFYETQELTWADDIPFVNTWMLKNIQSIKSKDVFNPDRLFKDAEDKTFGKNLFRKTVLNFSKYEEDIANKTPNWDSSRITKVDKLLMVMAIVEFQHFPSIPTKVSINEYIEISKDYATDKSSYFINGVLDKLRDDYTDSGKIKKIGRGLL